MYDFIFNYQATFGVAMVIYLIGGILLLQSNKRIRWYAFSFIWILLSSLQTLPFYAETCVLIVAFLFTEDVFMMYSPSLLAAYKKSGG